jgi:lysophospholipase L1-like esterase
VERWCDALGGDLGWCTAVDRARQHAPAPLANSVLPQVVRDGLHPSPTGYQKMAVTVDLTLFHIEE